MEPKFLWVVVVLANFVTISLQASSRESDSYVAAVVEYAPVSGATLENKEQIFLQNVANYACFMEEAARQEADIIVFPEIGLASMGVPHNPDGTPSLAFYVPEPGSNPCNDNSSDVAQGLKELSCAARRHGLYAVVNLPERVNCSGCPCPGFPVTVDGEQCPPSGAYFHNTNVAFDRTGTIVARYRKFNLFGEPGFVPTPEPEFSVFETDFGVLFGTFICFDILFEKPAVTLVNEYEVCDFAFPTAWYSEVPFLTAVQTQAAWAHSLDVNLLAAGYNKPEVGSAGSGIFLGRGGALQAVMPNTTTSRLLVGAVPKRRRCQELMRTRRSQLADGGDDDAVGQTPLSAFHHIVQQRKFGHLEEGQDVGEALVEEPAPAFIHHTMYDREDEGAQADDDSQPPSGEYESKVPPHFMGLQQADEGEADEQTDYTPGEEAAGGPEEQVADSRSPYGDIAEKKIPASTSTDTDLYGFSEPSQNPDLLRLYQDEPAEQLPEEFLEIEVPEIERSFEPEHDQEYFRLPDEEEIPPLEREKEEIQKEIKEEENELSPSTDDSDTGAADSADHGVPSSEENKETGEECEESVPTERWEASDGEVGTMNEEERNTTQEEIEAARKNFEWLVDDTDDMIPCDSPEQEHEEHDDTDDILPDDHGVHLLEEGGQGEEKPSEERVDDTDDILTDDHGAHELDDDEDGVTESDKSPKQEAEGIGEVIEASEADTLTDKKEPAEPEGEQKKPAKCRKRRSRRRRNRVKRSKGPCRIKPRPKEQESPKEPEGVVTDGKPDVETSEYSPECPTEDSVTEEQNTKADPDVASSKPKRPCRQRERPITDDKPAEETSVNDFEGVAEETPSEEQNVEVDPEVATKKPKCPCKQRERRESGCPQFVDGVLDDARVIKSAVGLFLKRDHLEVYKTFTLNTDSLIENSTVTLCDGTFCCNFHVVMEVTAELEDPRYAYRLAVFNGVRTFDGVATGGLQVCGVIPCSRDDMDSCGMLTLPETAAYATVFRNISISGVFSTNNTLVTANTLAPGLQPLPADRFNVTRATVAERLARVTLRTTDTVLEQGVSLFTFAIYSRVFQRDGQPPNTLPGAVCDGGSS